MKTCPKCGELLGDSVNACFKCRYDFNLRRVRTSEELSGQGNKQMEYEKQIQEQREMQLSKNPLFEYQMVTVNDLATGESDNTNIQNVLNRWSQDGWRLHTIYTNEIGKKATSVSVIGLGAGINATIEQTILIFERCIKS